MMTRNKYLKELRSFLGKLPKEDRKRILEFYNELIDDKLEAGQSEEEILGEFGSPEELAKQIFQETAKPIPRPIPPQGLCESAPLFWAAPFGSRCWRYSWF